MGNILKIELLDDCVDGSIEKLLELTGNNYEQFIKISNICKKIYASTTYSGIDFNRRDRSVSFRLIGNIDKQLLSEIEENLEEGTTIDTVDDGIIVNISVR